MSTKQSQVKKTVAPNDSGEEEKFGCIDLQGESVEEGGGSGRHA
jgi:hypothetical protein